MLTEEEKKFIESRIKIQKIAIPIVLLLIFIWAGVYMFTVFNYPELVKIDQSKNMPLKLLPAFFNLFMIVLLIMFIFMLVFLKVEREYLSIIGKIIEKARRGA